jgi:hypothetical protein
MNCSAEGVSTRSMVNMCEGFTQAAGSLLLSAAV